MEKISIMNECIAQFKKNTTATMFFLKNSVNTTICLNLLLDFSYWLHYIQFLLEHGSIYFVWVENFILIDRITME